MRYCHYHCRKCGAHFATLRAFDAHLARRRFLSRRGVPDYDLTHLDPSSLSGSHAMTEQVGTCRISQGRDHPVLPVSIFALAVGGTVPVAREAASDAAGDGLPLPDAYERERWAS
jgi:hypothetical protein